MAYDPIASRYAQALFETAKSDQVVDQTLEQLTLIEDLLRHSPELCQLMGNPDVDPDDKVGVFDRVLQQSWSTLVKSFVNMVISLGRSESLVGIVEAFRDAVDVDHERLRVLVRSAHALSEATLKRLRTRLEQREGKQIELQTEVAPDLLGGLQLVLGHRLIDGSVQRQLTELKNRLSTVRVS